MTQANAPHKADDSIWSLAKPLVSCTCPQCHGSGYLRLYGLDGHIDCPNCYGHGEVFQLDDIEVAE
jgi:DnaJ-class molecular chaperone